MEGVAEEQVRPNVLATEVAASAYVRAIATNESRLKSSRDRLAWQVFQPKAHVHQYDTTPGNARTLGPD